jgi:RNA polymerase sigma-70 factor, ECF subfamily
MQRAVYIGVSKGSVMATSAVDIHGELGATAHCGETRIEEFIDIVSCNLHALRRKALRQLKNSADAEDAVQDALLSAYKHLHQFKGEAKMSTWLTTIVINSARMKIRRRPQSLHISLDEQDPVHDYNALSQALSDRRPGPDEMYREREASKQLMQLSNRLSPTLRTSFVLCVLHELSIRETAQRLGLSESAVKTRVARARSRLKQLAGKDLVRSRLLHRRGSLAR